jgi:hypothetical protein
MQLASLGKHWPQRKMEWIMAGLTATWGLYVALHPEIFVTDPTADLFAGLAALTPFDFSPALFWGILAGGIGVARGVALYINGTRPRGTPVVRIMCSFVTMLVFFLVAYGLWQTGIANPTLVIYLWLIGADLLSCIAAGKDAMAAELSARIEQGTINGSRFSRSLGL